MVNELKNALKAKLPLTITFVECNELNLSMSGEGWTFYTSSSWRIVNPTSLYGKDDIESDKELAQLVGIKILAIESLGSFDIDMTLRLSNGSVLEIFCTTYYEPWLFDIIGEITYVEDFNFSNPISNGNV